MVAASGVFGVSMRRGPSTVCSIVSAPATQQYSQRSVGMATPISAEFPGQETSSDTREFAYQRSRWTTSSNVLRPFRSGQVSASGFRG